MNFLSKVSLLLITPFFTAAALADETPKTAGELLAAQMSVTHARIAAIHSELERKTKLPVFVNADYVEKMRRFFYRKSMRA